MGILIGISLIALAGFLWWRASRCDAPRNDVNVPRFDDEPNEP